MWIIQSVHKSCAHGMILLCRQKFLCGWEEAGMGRASSGLPWELGRGLTAMCGSAPKDLLNSHLWQCHLLWWPPMGLCWVGVLSFLYSEWLYVNPFLPGEVQSHSAKSQQSCLVLLCVTTWLCLLFLLTQLACQTVLQCRSCLEE